MAFRGVLEAAPERPSFGTQLARGLGSGFGAGLSQAGQFAQQMALEKQKSSNLAQQTKQLEKIKLAETGLGTISEMRKKLDSVGGWTSGISNKIQSLIPNSQAQQDRAELEIMGRSLIPLVAAGVSVRNQKEFDEYRKIITDTNSSRAQFEGALNGLQGILERSLEEEPERESKKGKQKFSSGNPEHRKKAEQLHKTYGDKEKVREILSREFEF